MIHNVLVIEPDARFAHILQKALQEEGYKVVVFSNAITALNDNKTFIPDLIISELIPDPNQSFLELALLRKKFPLAPCVILTDHDVDQWIEHLHEHEITNAYTKGAPFHTTEFLIRIKQLLTKDIFGLDLYFTAPTERKNWQLKSPADIDHLAQFFNEHCADPLNSNHIRMVMSETLSNAMFYGARNEKGENKLNWDRSFELAEHEAIRLEFIADDEKIGFSVLDTGGKLESQTVLYWLKRQICKDESGLPHGIFDHHGRGLFLTRKLMDRLYINVEKGKRSECIILYYRKEAPNKNKPISIAEI